MCSGLDTLAQLSTDADTVARLNLKLRARSKHISNAIVYKLAELDSPLKKSYWNTYHCNMVIEQKGDKMKASYCNNRWCLTCSRIRTAKLIRGYGLQISEFKDSQFVTLTAPTVCAEELPDELKRRNKAFVKIRKNIKKTYGLEIKGVRKLEITYNHYQDKYHPHFHLICEGLDVAEKVVELWLKQFPNADKNAQDIRKADNKSTNELFKYVTKLVATGKKQINALDWIYQCMRGKRLVTNYGIIKISEDLDDIKAGILDWKPPGNYIYLWNSETVDWVRGDGDLLSGYLLDDYTRDIVYNALCGNIDITAPPDIVDDVKKMHRHGLWQLKPITRTVEELDLFNFMANCMNPKPFKQKVKIPNFQIQFDFAY